MEEWNVGIGFGRLERLRRIRDSRRRIKPSLASLVEQIPKKDTAGIFLSRFCLFGLNPLVIEGKQNKHGFPCLWHLLAESWGFEPQIRFWRILA